MSGDANLYFDETRVIDSIRILKAISPQSEFEILGTGYETVVARDGRFIYKVFDTRRIDYRPLLDDFKRRFMEARRFPRIIDLVVVGDVPVLLFERTESHPYVGGHEEEMRLFLVECASLGVVSWDVKPLNFRVYEDGLKYTDYGWDIRPFNYKDFIFMVQRAFLTLRYPHDKGFKARAKRALQDWDMEDYEGFLDFLDEVYGMMVASGVPSRRTKELRLRDKGNVYRMVLEKLGNDAAGSSTCVVTQHPEDVPSFIASSAVVADSLDEKGPGYKLVILDLAEDLSSPGSRSSMGALRRCLTNDGRAIIIAPNPFFSPVTRHPLSSVKRFLLRSGLETIHIWNGLFLTYADGEPFSEHLIIEVALLRESQSNVSLLIKACAQDADYIESQVRHIVAQCEEPTVFLERLVVVDQKGSGFLRQYSEPDLRRLVSALEVLKADDVIDDYILAPADPDSVRRLNREWFGLDVEATHTADGVPVTPQLFGFEACRGEYVLQMDLDVIVGRRDRHHDFVGDMMADLMVDPCALSVSMNIAHEPGSPRRHYTSPGNGRFVPEVRFCLFNKERLLSHRPYPNSAMDGKLELTWYRSIERYQVERGLVSLRGGDPRSYYIHPPNRSKVDLNAIQHIKDAVEHDLLPRIQYEQNDLVGEGSDWALPKRREDYIFIVCGRNVPPWKFHRCWNSIVRQSMDGWGAIIIDDASENGIDEFIELEVQGHRERITYVRNAVRTGILQNIHRAIHEYCTNPFSVIVILDMDDMLLSDYVLRILHREYTHGAQMTVGGTFRLGKGMLRFVPDFEYPRNERCGDVWMHLRSFRRYLFTSIDREDFLMEGRWAGVFNELCYTVPIAEMATRPIHIRYPLYLWEPTSPRDDEHYLRTNEAKRMIATRRTYTPERIMDLPRVRAPWELIRTLSNEQDIVVFVRHSSKAKPDDENAIHDPGLTDQGVGDSLLFGELLPFKPDLIITSPSLRAVQTGEVIRLGSGADCPVEIIQGLRSLSAPDNPAWASYRERFGWRALTEKWVRDELDSKEISPAGVVIRELLEELLWRIKEAGAGNTVVVTHDHVILGLSGYLFDELPAAIGFLYGFCVRKCELSADIELESKKGTCHR